jgi:hypothetical protein
VLFWVCRFSCGGFHGSDLSSTKSHLTSSPVDCLPVLHSVHPSPSPSPPPAPDLLLLVIQSPSFCPFRLETIFVSSIALYSLRFLFRLFLSSAGPRRRKPKVDPVYIYGEHTKSTGTERRSRTSYVAALYREPGLFTEIFTACNHFTCSRRRRVVAMVWDRRASMRVLSMFSVLTLR